MDVLFCTHEPFLPLSGGCTLGNLRLAQSLQERGHRVRVLSPLQVEFEEAAQLAPGVECRRFEPWRMHRSIALRFPKYLLYALFYFWPLWREVSRRRPDLLFVRNAVLGLPVLWVARLRGIRCALSYTDLLSALLGGDRRFPRSLIALLQYYEVHLPRYFDQFFCISSGIQEAVGRGILTLDGADLSLFKPLRPAARQAERRALGIKAREPLVAFHGTIEAHHGQELIPKLVASLPELRFLIIGGGPGFAALQRNLGTLPNAVVLPFQKPERVAQLVASADAGMVPYEPSEGLDLVFTLKLLEYFAVGLPVTCFRLKSAQAIFGKSGYLHASASLAEFAKHLQQSVGQKPSLALRRRIQRDFSWEAVARRFYLAFENP